MEIKTLQKKSTIKDFCLKPHQHRKCLAKIYLWITMEHTGYAKPWLPKLYSPYQEHVN